jgi:hypothetical protein
MTPALPDPSTEHVQERVIAAALMAEMAGIASKSIDTSASRLLAGFGAAVTLLLTNHEALTLVPIATVRAGLMLFVWAAIVTVIQKYLAIIVASGAEGAASGRGHVKDYMKEQRDLGIKNSTLNTLPCMSVTAYQRGSLPLSNGSNTLRRAIRQT